MKFDNNNLTILCTTSIILIILTVLKFGNLSEQTVLILTGGVVTLAGTLIGNIQRKPVETTLNDINEDKEYDQ